MPEVQAQKRALVQEWARAQVREVQAQEWEVQAQELALARVLAQERARAPMRAPVQVGALALALA